MFLSLSWSSDRARRAGSRDTTIPRIIIFTGSGTRPTRIRLQPLSLCRARELARSCRIRGAGASLRATSGRCFPSPWLRVGIPPPLDPLSTPVNVLWRRDAGFQPSIRPQRRGGSRVAQTFVPVDPGRVILSRSASFFRWFFTDQPSVVSPYVHRIINDWTRNNRGYFSRTFLDD